MSTPCAHVVQADRWESAHGGVSFDARRPGYAAERAQSGRFAAPGDIWDSCDVALTAQGTSRGQERDLPGHIEGVGNGRCDP